MSRLRVMPTTLRAANAFVLAHHRHSVPVTGNRFSVAVVDASGAVRGVGIAGRPVSRMLDDGLTLEALRVCTDGARNACSLLYGAIRRAGLAMGYTRLVTYTLASEPGTSLIAAGFAPVQRVNGRPWSCQSRPRADEGRSIEDKVRWEWKQGDRHE